MLNEIKLNLFENSSFQRQQKFTDSSTNFCWRRKKLFFKTSAVA